MNISRNDRALILKKSVYYSSTNSLIKQLSIVSLILLGAVLIFRNNLELSIQEYYLKSSTISIWICVIGCGLTYYLLASNYKKSMNQYGVEEINEPESIKRARIFGSSKIEYLSIMFSMAMVACGAWFGLIFIILGLLYSLN